MLKKEGKHWRPDSCFNDTCSSAICPIILLQRQGLSAFYEKIFVLEIPVLKKLFLKKKIINTFVPKTLDLKTFDRKTFD